MFKFVPPHQVTPLHKAVLSHSVDTVRLLVEKGADSNIKEKDGGVSEWDIPLIVE